MSKINIILFCLQNIMLRNRNKVPIGGVDVSLKSVFPLGIAELGSPPPEVAPPEVVFVYCAIVRTPIIQAKKGVSQR